MTCVAALHKGLGLGQIRLPGVLSDPCKAVDRQTGGEPASTMCESLVPAACPIKVLALSGATDILPC